MAATLGWGWALWGQAATKTQGGIWVGRWENDAVVASSIRRVSPADGGTYLQPMMHPDGTRVVFWGRAKGADRRSTDIWIAKVDGSDCHKVTKDQARNEGASWTADGRIVWSTQRAGDPGMRIWVMDADGSNAHAVTAGPPPCHDTRPCVSPDGTTVVFGSNRAGGNQQKLWKAPLAGGKAEQVIADAGSHHRPVFSHDGKRLAWFTNASPTRKFNLVVMDWPSGKRVQPVSLGPSDNLRGPFWMRDNKRIIVHGRLDRSRSVRLYLIEVATGKWKAVDVPGSVSCGHGSLDREEKVITFDGARNVPAAIGKKTP